MEHLCWYCSEPKAVLTGLCHCCGRFGKPALESIDFATLKETFYNVMEGYELDYDQRTNFAKFYNLFTSDRQMAYVCCDKLFDAINASEG